MGRWKAEMQEGGEPQYTYHPTLSFSGGRGGVDQLGTDYSNLERFNGDLDLGNYQQGFKERTQIFQRENYQVLVDDWLPSHL